MTGKLLGDDASGMAPGTYPPSHAVNAVDRTPDRQVLAFTYRNWRGEVADRRVLASSVSFYFGSTDWHPEPQTLMRAIDLDKGAERDFAWKDIVRAEAALSQAPEAGDAVRVAVKPLEWELQEDDWWMAEASELRFGYEVRFTERRGTRVRFPGKVFEPFDGSPDAAKAAANADFERRVLSAIVPTGTAEPEVERLQPMDTAPKDGKTRILARSENGGYFVVWWRGLDHKPHEDEPNWYVSGTFVRPSNLIGWMPIPAKPAEPEVERLKVIHQAVWEAFWRLHNDEDVPGDVVKRLGEACNDLAALGMPA